MDRAPRSIESFAVALLYGHRNIWGEKGFFLSTRVLQGSSIDLQKCFLRLQGNWDTSSSAVCKEAARRHEKMASIASSMRSSMCRSKKGS